MHLIKLGWQGKSFLSPKAACKFNALLPRFTGSKIFHRVTFDARTCVEIQRGYALTFLFATEDVLSTWPPMYLPNLTMLHDKVSEMESSEIGVNFAFRENPKTEARTGNDTSAIKADD